MAINYVKDDKDKYKMFKLEQRLKQKFEKEKRKELMDSKKKKDRFYGNVEKQFKKLTKGKRSYRSGNPLKKLLKSSNKTIIRVGR